MLLSLVDNSKTDKNTIHSYLELYEKLLSKRKDTAKNVLEVGIANGGSIKLWSDYFKNATVYGLDVMHENNVWQEIKNKDNIVLYTSTDAYNGDTFRSLFLEKGIKFDFMLDDGPHTLHSMVKFITLYSQLMTENGILIIEDIQSEGWFDVLKAAVPEELLKYVKIYDLRSNKGRYDDMVFTIDKSMA